MSMTQKQAAMVVELAILLKTMLEEYPQVVKMIDHRLFPMLTELEELGIPAPEVINPKDLISS